MSRIRTRSIVEVDVLDPADAGNAAALAVSLGLDLKPFDPEDGNGLGLRLVTQVAFAHDELAERLRVEAALTGKTPRQVAEQALATLEPDIVDSVPEQLEFPADEPDEDFARGR